MKKYIFIVLTLLLVLATGCQNEKSGADGAENSTNGKTQTSQTSGMTVKDIKKKYGTDDRQTIMPMYNVENTKEFVFTFPYKIRDISPSDMISVHTDIKALPESKVLTFVSEDFAFGGDNTEITVKPLSPILPSKSDMNADEGTWGNAPIYYIRINYDLEAKEPKKLDQPIIVPFTVQSELPVPNLRKEISSDGRLKLVWDEVEGAEKYNIYQVSNSSLLETTNEPLSGAETGYKGIPQLQTTTTETEWQDFLGMGNGALNQTDDVISGQNMGVNGDYYVTAVAGDKESNFSVPVSTASLSSQLPKELEDNINFSTYENATELPKTVRVKFIDGTVQNRAVVYDTDVDINEEGTTKLGFSIKGTAMKGFVNVNNLTESDKTTLQEEKKDENNGFIEPQNEIDDVPDPSVPTIIEKDKAPESSNEPETSDDKKSDSKQEEESYDKEDNRQPSDTDQEQEPSEAKQDENNIDQQRENTNKHVEEGNKEEVVTPEIAEEIEIHAQSAFEEYLALKMINAESEISLEAFPEAQNSQTLQDTMFKVVYQNPLILGVEKYGYNYSTLTLYVEYAESPEVIKKKQEEIVKEAQKIVSSVTKSSMSDDEKRKALYDYLNDHTKYDDAALENAEQNNFRTVDDSFNDSFTTYGIMVKKVGVCQSYAMTYKMLGDLAGVETIVVTGSMNGVPHAWNKVKIGEEWLHVDSTNNETNSGIPYMIYQSNDETVKENSFITDNEYWLDSELGKFAGITDKYDYYVVNDLEVEDLTEFEAILTEELKAGNDTIILRLDNSIEEESLVETAATVIQSVAPNKIDTAQLGLMGQYVIVLTE